MTILMALTFGFLSFFSGGQSSISAELQVELTKAKKELVKAEKRVHLLEEKLARSQIREIEKALHASRREEASLVEQVTCDSVYALFHDERTLLAEIIQKVPSCSEEAQKVLDEILTLITALSDQI